MQELENVTVALGTVCVMVPQFGPLIVQLMVWKL